MDQIEVGIINKHKERKAALQKVSDAFDYKITPFYLWWLTFVFSMLSGVCTFAQAYPRLVILVPPTSPLYAEALSLINEIFFAVIMITAFIVLFYVGKDILWLSLREPIANFPTSYIALCLFMVLLVLISWFQSDFTIIARWGVIASLFCTVVTITRQRVEARSIRKEIDKAKKEAQEGKTTAKYCEVCSKESLYDLCLDCETKYRPERHRVRNQILRAKQAGVPATLTLSQWLENLSMYNWRCAYCQTGQYQVLEHYVPITSGGGTTQENCVPACYSCNSKKSNKHPERVFSPRDAGRSK